MIFTNAGSDVAVQQSSEYRIIVQMYCILSVLVPVLMLLYSIVAGTGLGLMYVPAVVAVGYYFDKRRAFATGKYFSLLGCNLKKLFCFLILKILLYDCSLQESQCADQVQALLCWHHLPLSSCTTSDGKVPQGITPFSCNAPFASLILHHFGWEGATRYTF